MRYFAPTTVDEAVGLLAESPGRKVFAGATDVIPQMRAGRPEPDGLIDLKHIDRLMGVRRTATGWVIGAATPTSQLTGNAELVAEFPGLCEGAGLIGSESPRSGDAASAPERSMTAQAPTPAPTSQTASKDPGATNGRPGSGPGCGCRAAADGAGGLVGGWTLAWAMRCWRRPSTLSACHTGMPK